MVVSCVRVITAELPLLLAPPTFLEEIFEAFTTITVVVVAAAVTTISSTVVVIIIPLLGCPNQKTT